MLAPRNILIKDTRKNLQLTWNRETDRANIKTQTDEDKLRSRSLFAGLIFLLLASIIAGFLFSNPNILIRLAGGLIAVLGLAQSLAYARCALHGTITPITTTDPKPDIPTTPTPEPTYRAP